MKTSVTVILKFDDTIIMLKSIAINLVSFYTYTANKNSLLAIYIFIKLL